MPEKTIAPLHAEELYDVADGTRAGTWTRVGVQHVRTRRWSEQYYLVVADLDGNHWGVLYDEGLTENQECDLPWKETDDPLPLVRLYPHQVVKTEYRTEAPA